MKPEEIKALGIELPEDKLTSLSEAITSARTADVQNVQKLVFASFGDIAPTDGEDVAAFIGRAKTTYATQAEAKAAEKLNAKIADLEGKLKNANTPAEVEALNIRLAEAIKAREESDAKLNETISSHAFESKFNKAVANIKIDPSQHKDFIQMKLEKASNIGQSLKPTTEGKDEYLYTENGKTEVLTFEGVMKRILAPIILPEGQAGTGTKAKEARNKSASTFNVDGQTRREVTAKFNTYAKEKSLSGEDYKKEWDAVYKSAEFQKLRIF